MMEIFVFGSNRKGIHGKGAALSAVQRHGAKRGQGEGLQGRSYGIPTKETPYVSLHLDDIRKHVATFIRFAESHPEMVFNLTAVGCGYAGYTPDLIAPMFEDAPPNVIMPDEFKAVLGP